MTKEDAKEQAGRAARGGLAVLVAKVFFIGTGLVQQALLPKAIGLADYGALSRVLAVSNVFNNVVVASSTQGVSRTVAGAPGAEAKAFRAALRTHVAIAVLASLLLLGAAPLVAYFQRAPGVLAPLVVMTSVLAVYGVYAPLVGYLNGRRQFVRQASLDIVAATLRTAGLLGVGFVFARGAGSLARAVGTSAGTLGATVGAAVASLGVFLLALRWTRTGEPGEGPGVPDVRSYVALIAPVMLGQLFTNGLMQADIFILGRYLSLSAPDIDAVTRESRLANEWVAVYRACQLFAFLPHQLLFSVTQVLFPMLARAKAEDGPERVAELVSRGARIGAIAAGMLVTVVVTLPESLIKFAYGADIAARGADALRLLALGQAAFAVLGLATTILVSLGRERTAMSITALALALLVTACFVALPVAEFGRTQLMTAAVATTTALTLALAVGATTAKRVAGAFVPWKTAVRVGLCIAVAFAAGRAIPVFSKLATPVVATGVVLAYLLALVVTGELGRKDSAFIVALVNRRANR